MAPKRIKNAKKDKKKIKFWSWAKPVIKIQRSQQGWPWVGKIFGGKKGIYGKSTAWGVQK